MIPVFDISQTAPTLSGFHDTVTRIKVLRFDLIKSGIPGQGHLDRGRRRLCIRQESVDIEVVPVVPSVPHFDTIFINVESIVDPLVFCDFPVAETVIPFAVREDRPLVEYAVSFKVKNIIFSVDGIFSV